MIRKIRHKGLEEFYRDGGARALDAKHVRGWGFSWRPLIVQQCLKTWVFRAGSCILKGERTGQWAASVSGNWRLVFEFEDNDARNVDFVDYH